MLCLCRSDDVQWVRWGLLFGHVLFLEKERVRVLSRFGVGFLWFAFLGFWSRGFEADGLIDLTGV